MNWIQINGFLENWTWKEEKIAISYTKFFDKKSCFVGFFYEKRMINKNQQFNFLSENLSLESNYFKWDGNVWAWKVYNVQYERTIIIKNNALNYMPGYRLYAKLQHCKKYINYKKSWKLFFARRKIFVMAPFAACHFQNNCLCNNKIYVHV